MEQYKDIEGNVIDEIRKLKAEDGKDILINGSGKLINTLMDHNIIDEYRLMVYPVVIGIGKRLFKDSSKVPLKLVETKKFDSGVVLLI